MKALLLLYLIISTNILIASTPAHSFFQASEKQPYHLSIGAVLFDHEGRIACHHFKDIFGYKDIYILMRETMENDETPLITLNRGLMEEFGASAKALAFLGCLSGPLQESHLSYEKSTLYIACRLADWDPKKRDPNDPESSSTIEWIEPNKLITLMQQQGIKFKRIDVDESEMIKRALPYIQQSLNMTSFPQKS